MNTSETNQVIVNGNEAVAYAALMSNISYFSHYPGSPINLVEPALKKLISENSLQITINDALNEHIAALSAAGASFCGARSMVVMKHVGMNIAADPLNYLGYTGVKGGMVIVVGTDPGANSSTGEEDVHWYVPQVNFPLFEPTSVKEIFNFIQKAYEVSEKYQVPVFVFVPGRLCYNSDTITVPHPLPESVCRKRFFFEKDKSKYINVGSNAVKNHQKLLEKIEKLSSDESFMKLFFNHDSKKGIITRGLTFGHTYESLLKLDISDKVHLLNLDMVFPLNRKELMRFFNNKDEVVIIEDQDGFLENQIKDQLFNDLDCKIYGKNIFPKYGEIEFSAVYAYLAEKYLEDHLPQYPAVTGKDIPERLGIFCEGCPHRGSFFAIESAIDRKMDIIGGDIGCSSLPPFRADWLLCMNAGIGISQGMSQVLNDQTVISTGGESSFFHGGLISLQNAVVNRMNFLHIVFDNRCIGMTGRQDSPTTNSTVNYKKLLKSIGVKHVTIVSALKPKLFSKILSRKITQSGVKVIWVDTPCSRKPNAVTSFKRKIFVPRIESQQCGDCTVCYSELGCPAIRKSTDQTHGFEIDENACAVCGVCKDICPNSAIRLTLRKSIAETITNICESIFS